MTSGMGLVGLTCVVQEFEPGLPVSVLCQNKDKNNKKKDNKTEHSKENVLQHRCADIELR